MKAPPPPKERTVQRDVLAMVKTCFPRVIYHHSPNGAHLAGGDASRFRQVGALLGDGMQRGWPDLQFIWAGGMAFIEVKRPKLGKLSDVQIAVHERLQGMGWPVATITSSEEAYWFLKGCGAPCQGELAA